MPLRISLSFTLMENETYHSEYYGYMQRLVDEYINGGSFDAFYKRVRSQIDELVKTDPAAFFTYDEYLLAVDTLYNVVKLRGESIRGQLDGTIPSTESEQRNSTALIDASSIDLSVMGSINMSGGGFGFGGRPSRDNFPGGQMNGSSQGVSGSSLALWAITLLVLTAAILFAVFYRRKPRKR